MTTDIERHAPGTWRATADRLLRAHADTEEKTGGARTNRNGAPLLGDSRDLFRPRTGDIPAAPGVYKWRDADGRVIYVGKARNLRNRITDYFQPLHQLHPRTQTMVLTARSLEWTTVTTELEALTLEYLWIKEFDPRFNVQFRDDKTYPYLAITTDEPYPRIWVTRTRGHAHARYYGPYAKPWELRRTLDQLQHAYPVRTCTSGAFRKAQRSNRPCLLASVGKCAAPCIGRITPDEHRRLCEQLIGIMTGRLGRPYIAGLTRQMKEASAALEFEKAARLRDEIKALEAVTQRNAVVLDDHVDADVFGLASDELEASVHAFYVRDGTIRGERNWNVERVEDVSDAELVADLIVQVYGASHPTPASGTRVATTRDAIGATQSMTAVDASSRAQATRERRDRQERTGRIDLLAPIAPVPREIIVPVEPARRDELESWLTAMRGSTVSIRTAMRGDKKALMDRASQNADQALQRSKTSRISDMGARSEAMNEIAEALGLPQTPLRIECYDVSNTVGGAYQVASMVVFEDAIARKPEYRRFAIRGEDGAGAVDDLSALYETLTRRFRHGNIAGDSGETLDASTKNPSAAATAPSDPDGACVARKTDRRRFAYKPNLIVVDGGRPQVMAAARALADCGVDDVALCGLAKRLEEVWVPDDDYPIILKRQSEGMYLLQRVRDESHRFAIDYHRRMRRKGTLHSALDDIPGVGPAYRKRLLAHFGSVRAMREASVEDLMAVQGIGRAKAEAIHTALHPSPADPNGAGDTNHAGR